MAMEWITAMDKRFAFLWIITTYFKYAIEYWKLVYLHMSVYVRDINLFLHKGSHFHV